GDQLPKVREVAQALAINPNTVLKAYRELEIEGLAEGRPGIGTFIRATLAGASLANQAELRGEFVGWLRRARAAGLSAEDVAALVETTMRTAVIDEPAAAARDRTDGPDAAARKVRTDEPAALENS